MYSPNYGGGGHHRTRDSRNYQSSYPTQYGQNYSSGSSGPPAGADPQLWQWFRAVDTDGSGSISVTELQAALGNGNWTRFDLDTTNMLMNIFDTDRSGNIGYQEFTALWKYIGDWQGVFRHFDKDRSGTIDAQELAEALRSFGYRLTPGLLALVEQKYASGPTTVYGTSPGITFDRFVRACVAVKTLTEAFQRCDVDRDGWVTMSYEDFMGIALRAP